MFYVLATIFLRVKLKNSCLGELTEVLMISMDYKVVRFNILLGKTNLYFIYQQSYQLKF